MELNEKKVTFDELKDYFLNGPKYTSWTLVTDDFFSIQVNIDRVIYDGYGYCILTGNNRVDVWNPDYPNSDLYKKERDKFNKKDHGRR